MRRRVRRPSVTYTARLIEPPEPVRRLAEQLVQNLGYHTYQEPFEIASILRAYGVRVIAALGEHALEVVRSFTEHRDPRVRAAAADELRRHGDVAALDILSRLASEDQAPEVREVAQQAVQELRQLAEKLEAQERAARPSLDELLEQVAHDLEAEAPAAVGETGEDATPPQEPQPARGEHAPSQASQAPVAGPAAQEAPPPQESPPEPRPQPSTPSDSGPSAPPPRRRERDAFDLDRLAQELAEVARSTRGRSRS
ncbi:MAG: hypothetical protein KatS3mg115_0079 [Candidatus Poribacteria bacterium]|nr:MAG: hypothetical protein KatS3mg115_0079 [Candidatus Poribacteria bacterium]